MHEALRQAARYRSSVNHGWVPCRMETAIVSSNHHGQGCLEPVFYQFDRV